MNVHGRGPPVRPPVPHKRVHHLGGVDHGTDIEAGDAAPKQRLGGQKPPPVSAKCRERFAKFHLFLKIVIARHFGNAVGHVQAAEGGQDAHEQQRGDGGKDATASKRGGQIQHGGARQGIDGDGKGAEHADGT